MTHHPGSPERRPGVATVGILITALGGLALSATFVVSSAPLAIAGAVLFVGGVVVVAVGGGLKTAWDVAKSLFP